MQAVPVFTISGLRRVVQENGLPAAVAYLNATVPHRFSGVFLAEDALLRNIALFDKRDPRPALWAPFPLSESFCSVMIASGKPLLVNHADADARSQIVNHPAAAKVQAYCGVPLMDEDGRILGSLCHFDVDLSSGSEADLEMMLQVSNVLIPFLGANTESAERGPVG